jgi:hypothetical protein
MGYSIMCTYYYWISDFYDAQIETCSFEKELMDMYVLSVHGQNVENPIAEILKN